MSCQILHIPMVLWEMDKPKAGLRQRIFAWALARFNARYERFASKYKEQLFAEVSGTVLEIGPGTGVNLRYLKDGKLRWIGVEPNPFMQRYLQPEASRLGMPIELRIGTADTLPVADSSVDAVISTLILCCVNDQQQSLQEVVRVLRPGGSLVFIEHCGGTTGKLVAVRSKPGDADLEAIGGWV